MMPTLTILVDIGQYSFGCAVKYLSHQREVRRIFRGTVAVAQTPRARSSGRTGAGPPQSGFPPADLRDNGADPGKPAAVAGS